MGQTKVASDKATALVIADLVANDCQVFVPLGENSPVDLVALLPGGKPIRLQVRYTDNVRWLLRLTNTVYRKGIHKKVRLNQDRFDYFVLVRKDKIAYVDTATVPGTQKCQYEVQDEDKVLPWKETCE